MKKTKWLMLALLATATDAAEPRRIDRAEAFLGVHFDLHASKGSMNIGARTTREMVATIIDKIGPDYIQCDCKGHPGYSSYPTKAGNPAPGIVGDPLRIWRDVTRERGVALFMHYSGVWDAHAVTTHPDWAARKADGRPDAHATSVFGPYVDRLMIPQLRELAGVYEVDGAWVDGDCWGATPDYSEPAAQMFRAKFKADPPRKRGEPLWNEWMDFNREGFRSYLRHYVDALKSSHPRFQLISNWAFSDHMPESVSADVVALSGDFSPEDSVNSARFTARCFENQGRAWDLMAWGFNRNTRQTKTAVALQQEAAVVLALGGGFQTYFKQDRDAAIANPGDLDVMGEVAKFCRERQAFCHRSTPVPQVGLLYARAGHYRASGALFHPGGDPAVAEMKRTLTGLLAAQYSVQVVSEHHLAGHMSRWPLLVVPPWTHLEPSFRDELAAYAREGGLLLLVGEPALALFAAEMRATNLASLGSANIRDIGRGRMAAIAAGADPQPVVGQLFPAPIVKVTGSRDVDVNVRRLNGKLMIDLVNTAGAHANRENKIVEAVPPAGPLQVAIRLPRQPRAVILQPGNAALAATWLDGAARVTLPRLELLSILQVEE